MTRPTRILLSHCLSVNTCDSSNNEYLFNQEQGVCSWPTAPRHESNSCLKIRHGNWKPIPVSILSRPMTLQGRRYATSMRNRQMADVLLLYTPKGYLSRRSLHHIDRGFAMLPNIGPEFVEALLSRTTNKLASLTECASTQKARSPCFIQGFYAPCSFPHPAVVTSKWMVYLSLMLILICL